MAPVDRMKMSWKFVIVALVGAVVGFAFESNGPIGSSIWPAPEGSAEPSAALMPGFIAMGVFEALAFGIGVAFLVFAWPLAKRVAPEHRGWTTAMFLSVAWLLVNWVPHTALHISNEADDLGRLLGIEYGFHFTLIIAGVILAWGLTRLLMAAPPTRARAA